MTFGAPSALAAAFLLVMLLLRMQRDAGSRHDTQYFFAAGGLAVLRLLAIAVVMLGGWRLQDHRNVAVFLFNTALLSNYMLVLFSYSFPFNRRAPRGLLLATGLPTLAVGIYTVDHAFVRTSASLISAFYYLPLVAVATIFQHRNRRQVAAEAGRAAAIPIAIVQASIVLPWITSVLTMIGVIHLYSFPPPQSALLAQAVLSTFVVMAGITVAILRYHLLDIRVMAYELVVAVGASFALGTYVALGAPALYRWLDALGGVHVAAPVLSIIPPAILGAGWLALARHLNTLACAMARRDTPRSAVERVIDVTRSVVDPEGVLAMVAGEITAATSGDVTYMRASSLPSDEYALAPQALTDAAHEDLRPFFATTQRAELGDALARTIDTLRATLIVPVRRGAAVYGFFIVRGRDVARNTALVCVALSDHLAIKLENYSLFTEAANRRRELHETRETLGRQLEESRRLAALGSFAAAIAHDIRTPLTSIQMNVQILRSKACLSTGDREYLDIAVEEIETLTRSVGEILDFAKQLQLAEEATELRDLLEDVRRTIGPQYSERGVELAIRFDGTAQRGLIDARRMRQVLVNLLDNAADASSRGGRVTVNVHRMDDGGVGIDVVDQGRGIAAGDLEKIFDPFFTTRPDGTGLGLAIAHKIVRAHRGEIVVESEPGQSTMFRVHLPPSRTLPAAASDTALGESAPSAAE